METMVIFDKKNVVSKDRSPLNTSDRPPTVTMADTILYLSWYQHIEGDVDNLRANTNLIENCVHNNSVHNCVHKKVFIKIV